MIAIIGIMTAGSVAILVALKRQSQIQNTADTLKSYILEAHAGALAPREGTNDVQSVLVRIEKDSNDRWVFKLIEKSATAESVIQTYSEIPSSVSFYPNDSDAICNPSCDIIFDAKTAGQIGQLTSGDPQTIYAKKSDGSETETVKLTINKFGAVEITSE